jgi:hypothetical protein
MLNFCLSTKKHRALYSRRDVFLCIIGFAVLVSVCRIPLRWRQVVAFFYLTLTWYSYNFYFVSISLITEKCDNFQSIYPTQNKYIGIVDNVNIVDLIMNNDRNNHIKKGNLLIITINSDISLRYFFLQDLQIYLFLLDNISIIQSKYLGFIFLQ